MTSDESQMNVVSLFAGVLIGAMFAAIMIFVVAAIVGQSQKAQVEPVVPERRQPTPSYPYYPPNGATGAKIGSQANRP
jgi:hypothetical protein